MWAGLASRITIYNESSLQLACFNHSDKTLIEKLGPQGCRDP